MPLQGKRITPETTSILDDLLINQIHAVGQYAVVGSSDLNAMLSLEKMKSALGCDDVMCAVEIGGALGVRYVVAGTASTLGGEMIVTLKLIDIPPSRSLLPYLPELRQQAQLVDRGDEHADVVAQELAVQLVDLGRPGLGA